MSDNTPLILTPKLTPIIKPKLTVTAQRALIEELADLRTMNKAGAQRDKEIVAMLTALELDTLEGSKHKVQFTVETQQRIDTVKLRASFTAESLEPYFNVITIRKCIISPRF